jgi:lysozyme
MPLNKATIDLITDFEGFVGKWYPDPAHGWKVPTCCYGHTDAAGEPKYATTKDKLFTRAEGAEILARDLAPVERVVRSYVKVPLNDNQLGALVSFTFNLGGSNFAKSTLLKKVNARDFTGAAKEFARWNRAAGKVLPGLTRRRAAEAKLFLAEAFSGQGPLPPSTDPVPEVPGTQPHVARSNWLVALISAIIEIIKGFRK